MEKKSKEQTNIKHNLSKKITYIDIKDIKDKIKSKKTIPNEKRVEISNLLIPNIYIVLTFTIYCIFLNLAYVNIGSEVYIVDLKLFSLVLLGIGIILFEKAYKKDNEKIAVYGIEFIMFAISNLIYIYIYIIYNSYFQIFVFIIAISFNVYYMIKSIIIYRKFKKKYLEKVNDIKNIIKK